MRQRIAIAVALLLAAAIPSTAAAGFASTFLYALSDSTGRIPYSWASLSWDPHAAELYVVSSGIVDVFSDNGMAIYGFASDTGRGPPHSIAAVPSGDLFVLAGRDGKTALARCNFRGDAVADVPLEGLPADFAAEFNPDAVVFAKGNLYLADKGHARVAVASLEGAILSTWDFQALLGVDDRHREDANMRAFNVDASGNMLFTITTFFTAYVVSPEGRVRQFGQKGSTPGKFGTVAGIAADESGHLYVSDTLRAAVLVFDAADLSFLGEFGGRYGPGGLVSPMQVAASGGKVYVTQSVGGVKVFAVQFD